MILIGKDTAIVCLHAETPLQKVAFEVALNTAGGRVNLRLFDGAKPEDVPLWLDFDGSGNGLVVVQRKVTLPVIC
jgi:hypothetical protein